VIFFYLKNWAPNLYPIEELLDTYDTVGDDLKDFLLKDKNLDIFSEFVVIQLKLKSLFPMKKEYWTESRNQEYSYSERSEAFMKFIKSPELYELLAVCKGQDTQGKWYFNPIIPFRSGTDKKVIEQFMYGTNVQVAGRSKYSGIYTVQNHFRYNWRERKVIKSDKKTKRKNLSSEISN